MTSSDLVTRQEAGQILGYSANFVSKAVKLGYLKAKKLNPIMVIRSEVEDFLEALDTEIIRKISAITNNRDPDAPWGEKSERLPVRRAGEPGRPGRKPGSGALLKNLTAGKQTGIRPA